MRTPGHDFELAAGFLFSEGILHDAAEIQDIRWSHIENSNPRQLGNSVTVDLKPGVEVDLDRLERHFYTTSSCGVCGKASIEAVIEATKAQGCPVLPRNAPVVAASVIHSLPETLRARNRLYSNEPAGCTPPRFSIRKAISSSCAKTSAAITPSTN